MRLVSLEEGSDGDQNGILQVQSRRRVEGRGWRRQRFGGWNFCLRVTRDSVYQYTLQSRHRLAPPLSHFPHHIGRCPCLLIQRECAHTGPQDRGSVLTEYGRGGGVPWSVVRLADVAPPTNAVRCDSDFSRSNREHLPERGWGCFTMPGVVLGKIY